MHHLAQSSILNHQESRELGGVLNAHMGCAHVGWLQVSPLTLSGYFQTREVHKHESFSLVNQDFVGTETELGTNCGCGKRPQAAKFVRGIQTCE